MALSWLKARRAIVAGDHAALRTYRWWSPPTRGRAYVDLDRRRVRLAAADRRDKGASALTLGAPSPRWPQHDGSPGKPDADYLVAPDAAIGQVVSAETNRGNGAFYPMDATHRMDVLQWGRSG